MSRSRELLRMLCRPPPRVERVTITLAQIFWPVPQSENRAVKYWPEFFRKLPR
jgi:hypothetical protein